LRSNVEFREVRLQEVLVDVVGVPQQIVLFTRYFAKVREQRVAIDGVDHRYRSDTVRQAPEPERSVQSVRCDFDIALFRKQLMV
jgi:hypothetical protein